MSYLPRLPITTLKVDPSLTATLQVEKPGVSSGKIVRTVIQLAPSPNLTVVAAGVETFRRP